MLQLLGVNWTNTHKAHNTYTTITKTVPMKNMTLQYQENKKLRITNVLMIIGRKKA